MPLPPPLSCCFPCIDAIQREQLKESKWHHDVTCEKLCPCNTLAEQRCCAVATIVQQLAQPPLSKEPHHTESSGNLRQYKSILVA